MSETNSASSAQFIRSKLPWIGVGISLVVYLFTLNRWVTFESLAVVSKVTGWDWNATISAPVLHLITLPFRFLPDSIVPIALNAFTAVCAALIIGLLMRSISLMPHDRTREQRQRLHGRTCFEASPLFWIPPVGAALVCGLQLTFWEHATAVTGQILNLLFFAYVIRCLFEFHASGENRWLYRAAFVYALGITNTFAFIGFLPFFIGAVIWLKRVRFFDFQFLMTMAGLGLVGLLMYLFLPIIQSASENTEATFWQLLKTQLVAQKDFLLFSTLRNRAFLLSFTSIVPIIFMGIRWPSNFGDMSAAGSMISTVMFRMVHALFLVGCLYVAFDPSYSPRQLGFGNYGIPFITFYYLGALCVGYYGSYLLLVFSVAPEKKWQRSREPEFLNRILSFAVILALLVVPIGLVVKNWSSVQAGKSTLMKEFAMSLVENLPNDQASVVLSDEPNVLLLAQAADALRGSEVETIFLNTKLIEYPRYHDHFAEAFPDRWHSVDTEGVVRLNRAQIVGALSELADHSSMFYLQPSYGFYFERFYQTPSGITYDMTKYGREEIAPPATDAQTFEANDAFWSEFMNNRLNQLDSMIATGNTDAGTLGVFYSRALNNWGVIHQREKGAESAKPYFEASLDLSRENLPAEINLGFNEVLASGNVSTYQTPASVLEKFQELQENGAAMLSQGGPVDEPSFCLNYGRVMELDGNPRQAAIQYSRTFDLFPDRVDIGLLLAEVYQKNQVFSKVFELIEQFKNSADFPDMGLNYKLAIIRLETLAQFGSGEPEAAIETLRAGDERYPDLPQNIFLIAQAYFQQKNYEAALSAVDEMLQRFPENLQGLFLKSNVLINQGKIGEALKPVVEILVVEPKNIQALTYRARIYAMQENWNAALQDYKTLQESYPDLNAVNLGFAEVAQAQGNTTEAIRYYQKFIDDEDENSALRVQVEEKIRQLESMN